MQATLFNKHIETWKDSLKPNKSYYILVSHLDRVNPNYSSVHREVELAFTNNTIIKECAHDAVPYKFYDGFVSLENAEKLPTGDIFGKFPPEISFIPVVQYRLSNTIVHYLLTDLIWVLVVLKPLTEIKYIKLEKL